MAFTKLHDDYSFGEVRGSMVITRLKLTGWGSQANVDKGLDSWSDQGRLWAVFTASTSLLELFKRSTLLAADLVASGTVTAGKVTLAEANSSGITGAADVYGSEPGVNPTSDSAVDIIVTYATEADLVTEGWHQIASTLDSNGNYPGTVISGDNKQVRFEKLLIDSKQHIDSWIRSTLGSKLEVAAEFDRPFLADVENVERVNVSHALLACSFAARRLQGNDPSYIDTKSAYAKDASKEFATIEMYLDYEKDGVSDEKGNNNTMRLNRA